jgi:hypothetical protein
MCNAVVMTKGMGNGDEDFRYEEDVSIKLDLPD